MPTDHRDQVTLCATPCAALAAWDLDPQAIIVINAAATLYAVGHEQPVDFWYPHWRQTSPEELEDGMEDEQARLMSRPNMNLG